MPLIPRFVIPSSFWGSFSSCFVSFFYPLLARPLVPSFQFFFLDTPDPSSCVYAHLNRFEGGERVKMRRSL